MKQKLKIAIYSGDIPSTTFIERLIYSLSSSGCHIYLFGFIKCKVHYNDKVSVFGYRNTRICKGLYVLKYSVLLFLFRNKQKSKLKAILKRNSQNKWMYKVKYYPVLWHHPDVFHIQWAKGVGDWMWVKDFGIKIVVSLRGAHINYSPIADASLAATYRKHFPNVDGFHAVSKAIAGEAEKYNADRDKIKIIYSGVHVVHEQQSSRKKQDSFQILSVGRPHWIKGYHYALDAIKLAKAAGLDVTYTIIGGAHDIELLYQLKDLELQDNVELLERIPNDEVLAYMQQSDVLLLPSVEEGIANVVLEALSLKTLVLTTNCGGMDEVITDSYNGFVVPIRDSKAIANALVQIRNLSPEKHEDITANGFKTVKTQHNIGQLSANMWQLYEEVSQCNI